MIFFTNILKKTRSHYLETKQKMSFIQNRIELAYLNGYLTGLKENEESVKKRIDFLSDNLINQKSVFESKLNEFKLDKESDDFKFIHNLFENAFNGLKSQKILTLNEKKELKPSEKKEDNQEKDLDKESEKLIKEIISKEEKEEKEEKDEFLVKKNRKPIQTKVIQKTFNGIVVIKHSREKNIPYTKIQYSENYFIFAHYTEVADNVEVDSKVYFEKIFNEEKKRKYAINVRLESDQENETDDNQSDEE